MIISGSIEIPCQFEADTNERGEIVVLGIDYTPPTFETLPVHEQRSVLALIASHMARAKEARRMP